MTAAVRRGGRPFGPRCAALLVCALLLAPAAGWAERRALLVGVQDYAPGIAALAPPLSGPANDVALMRRALLRLGTKEGAITTLVSGTAHPAYGARPADGPATRATILAALDRLAETAQPGDEVVILLAGHGTRLPAAGPGADADGWDEAFLPADFTLSREGGVTVARNHIRDGELGRRLSAILGRGASVWLIADTCHAGGLERNAGGPGVARLLPLVGWETGGLRDGNPPDPPGHGREALTPGRAMPGSAAFVGFYAAPSGSLALEAPLGPGDAGARPVHGLLSWAVAQALARGDGARFSDIARAARAGAWAWGRPAPEPVFAGDLGRATGFPGAGFPGGGGSGLSVRAAPDGALRVDGGRLDGIGTGDLLDVALPGGGFAVEVQAAGLVEARVAPVAGAAGAGALAALIAAEGLDPARFRDRWLADRAPAMVARPRAAGLSEAVRLALPEGLPPALSARIEAAVALASAEVALAPVAPGAAADVALAVADGAILAEWDPAQEAGGPMLRAEGASVAEIAGLIVRAARARRLVTAATAFAATPAAQGLSAELLVAPAAGAGGACAPLTEVPVAALPGAVPAGRAGRCDHVQLRLANAGAGPLDLAPFYLAPDGGLHYLPGYPGGDLYGLRLDPGASAFVSFTEDGSLPGPARLIVLALPPRPDAPFPADLRALAAPGPALRTGGGTRTAPLAALARLLVAAPVSVRLRGGGPAAVEGGDPGPAAGAVVLTLAVSGP